MSEFDDEIEGYAGPADIEVPDRPVVTVDVQLAGHFEPISGRYVWHGRVRRLTENFGSELPNGTEITITTPHGAGGARVTGIDLWGSHLVDGTTQPPFDRA